MHKDELKQRVLTAYDGVAEQVLAVDDETYLAQALLQAAVADAVFPEGVSDEASYAKVVKWASSGRRPSRLRSKRHPDPTARAVWSGRSVLASVATTADRRTAAAPTNRRALSPPSLPK